ncbi:MAG: hypothetical protein M3Y22_12470 [Pseudomonadota bacterium]|nr:hypothetical protein [Pseudomonadota bacterium]
MRAGAKRAPIRLAPIACMMLIAPEASAHVKWFTTTDVRTPPLALADVLGPAFLAGFGVFAMLVFAGFLLDSHIARRWPAIASSGSRHEHTEEALIRLGTGAYFLCLWDQGGAILTPELLANAAWVTLIQFAIAALVIWRSTCIVAGFGIIALYADGLVRYGVFHMTDYLFFVGTAAYLALISVRSPRLRRLREPILIGSLAFSLMWTAIEKFVYPQWTRAVVGTYPNLAMGFPIWLAIMIAGFVEFTLAFYLATGRGVLRLGAAAFGLIFLSAIPEFGHVDSVGHLLIVAILGTLCLHGASPLQQTWHGTRRGLILDAAGPPVLYLSALITLFAAYYGLHWAEFG